MGMMSELYMKKTGENIVFDLKDLESFEKAGKF
jgi:hypothetical protein